jgi:SOS-response transcriptional repressor LexA
VVVAKVHSNQIVEYLRTYHSKHGYAPSVREIADHFGVGISTAHRHLHSLMQTEEITAEAGRSRTWRASRRA